MPNESAIHQIADKLPRISPRSHSFMDYAMAGAFLAAGAFFFRRNKRAALGAAMCGAATLAVSVITDYESRGGKQLSYRTHGNVHSGLVTLAGSVPRLLDFEEEGEARFFRAAAAAGTVVTVATDYELKPKRLRR